jgi:hypothetical protein
LTKLKNRKTERQKDRKTERQKDRKTERQKGRKTERKIDRKIEKTAKSKPHNPLIVISRAHSTTCSEIGIDEMSEIIIN